MDVTDLAPDGTVWLCGACGKTNKDREQIGDTSCRTWAVLVDEASIERNADGKIVAAKAFTG